MTAARADARVRRVRVGDVPALVAQLESGFGDAPRGQAALANQFVLDALDRGQHAQCVVWPVDDPVAVLYAASSGTLMPSGAAGAAELLAAAAERVSWRVLVGDARIAEPLLRHATHGLFRRRPAAREQRFMIDDPALPASPPPEGFRRARTRDLERCTDFACALHTEDRMGPPISRAGRLAVRSRVAASIERATTWVVERDAAPVAKFDLSLHSRRRGAQIAGVYVDPAWRGAGLASGAVAAIVAELRGGGLPGVTLHVRSDNASGRAAYVRAGFVDRGAWTLAIR